MLGLGRALGETMALYMILRTTSQPFGWSLFDGGDTFASKIASATPEFNNAVQAGAYIAAGLVLFVLTFVVNPPPGPSIAGKKDSDHDRRHLDRAGQGARPSRRSAPADASRTRPRDRPGDRWRSLVALIPLVWVLVTVVIKGLRR